MNDNLASSDVADSIGSNTGTAYGSTPQTTADVSVAGVSASTTPVSGHGALSFNGTSDVIQAPSTITASVDFTISSWFKIADISQFHTIIGNYQVSNVLDGTFFLWTRSGDNDKLQFYLYDSEYKDMQSDDALITGNWYHAVIVRNAGTISMYLNGMLQTQTISSSFVIGNTGNSTYIGSSFDGDSLYAPMYGNIDDVRVYSRALSSADVAALYNGGAGTEDQ